MDEARLLSIQVGRIAPLGPKSVPSAFIKHMIEGLVAVGAIGLVGDEQADPAVHGGRHKAVRAYPAARYIGQAAEYPEHRDRRRWR